MRKKHLEAEENLKLQQAELMALFASLAPDPIFRTDESGLITLANNSAHKIFPNKTLLGEHVHDILPFTSNYDLTKMILENITLMDTIRIEKSYYQFLIVGSSRFKMCQVYGRDITELALKENQLKSALDKAEESKKLKEFFLAQISHEIRSPLNVIVGYSDLISDELKGTNRDDLSNILRSIKNNSKRLYRTFDLLLNMSQLQTGRYEIRIEKVDLLSILNTIYVEYKSMAEEKGLNLVLNNTLEENVIVFCDHYSISQAFNNIIDNAIKYTQGGSIEIKLYRDDGNLCIDIVDTGKGMSKDFIDQLFTPFTQEEMGYTRRFDGTGLGLAIVKNFIELNDANIKVTSEKERGTKFTVIFNGDKKWNTQTKKNQNS